MCDYVRNFLRNFTKHFKILQDKIWCWSLLGLKGLFIKKIKMVTKQNIPAIIWQIDHKVFLPLLAPKGGVKGHECRHAQCIYCTSHDSTSCQSDSSRRWRWRFEVKTIKNTGLDSGKGERDHIIQARWPLKSVLQWLRERMWTFNASLLNAGLTVFDKSCLME